MPLKSLGSALRDTLLVIKDSIKVVKEHPELAIYPYAATLFISITYPLVNATVLASWYGRIFYETGVYVPHKIGLVLGVVGFSVFYAALISAYFSCAVTAAVIAKMESRPIPPFYGPLRVVKNFIRVTRFALISVFFFPLGLYAQRRRLPERWAPVLGSSVTLRMAQVAPAVLTTNKNVGETIIESIDVLGQAWRQGLVLKLTMYLVVFLILALPKLIQKGFFHSPSASSFGWILSLEIAVSGLVAVKVINSIFTAVMYHQARQNKR